MALLIQPTKITKKLIAQIEPYHLVVTEIGSDWGSDQIEDLIENLIPLFKTCSAKKQKQVVDKIIGDQCVEVTWVTDCICEYIFKEAVSNIGSVQPKLIKWIYKKYLYTNPSYPKSFKKHLKAALEDQYDDKEERKNAMAYFLSK